jgi:hypothetical protein
VISSGLTTIAGTSINLYSIGGEIVGKTSSASDADVYFKLKVDADGQLTFSRLANSPAVKHANSASSDDNVQLNLNSGSASTSFAVTLTQSVKDGDGDVDSSSINVLGSGTVSGGPAFIIQDDGPDARLITEVAGEANPTVPPSIVLDESTLSTASGARASDNGRYSGTVDLKGYFVNDLIADGNSVDYGTDGKGSVDYRLSLEGLGSGESVSSGLFALDNTQTDGKGNEIFLYQIGDVIVGSTELSVTNVTVDGANSYFTLKASSTGVVTFSLLTSGKNIWHSTAPNNDDTEYLSVVGSLPGSVASLSLIQSVTDADGDVDSVVLDLLGDGAVTGGASMFGIRDDGPSSVATLSNYLISNQTQFQSNASYNPVSVSDTFADSFDINYGTDGSAAVGAVSYALSANDSADSGLYVFDSSATDNKGAAVKLYQLNGSVYGLTAAQVAAAGDVATAVSNGDHYFSLSVNAATGEVTLDQTQGQRIWMPTAGTATIKTVAITDVNLVQTVKDGDLDTSATALDLGKGAISFTEVEIPTIWVDDVHVNEKDGTLTFTLLRKDMNGANPFLTTNPSVTTVSTIQYEVKSGSASGDDATEGDDFTASGIQTISFEDSSGAAVDSVTVTVDITDDDIYEVVERFTIELSDVTSGSGFALIANRSANGFIHDDGTRGGVWDPSLDDDRPALTVVGGTVEEGSSAVYDVSLSKAIAFDADIQLELIDAEAKAAELDYVADLYEWGYDSGNGAITWSDVPPSGVISLPAETLTFKVRVKTLDDDVYEGSEDFQLKASFISTDLTYDPASTGRYTDTGTYQITDDGTGVDGDDDTDDNPDDGNDTNPSVDDDRPQMVIDSVTVEEGSSAVFAVTVGKAKAPYDVSFDITTDGTAEPGDVSTSFIVKDSNGTVIARNNDGTYTVPAGETQLFVTVSTIDDSVYERSETFELNGQTEFMSDKVQGIGTITDDGSGVDGDDDTDSNPTDGTDNDRSVDDDRPQMTIGNVSVEEGSSAVFAVTVGEAEDPYEVFFNTGVNGSAESDDIGTTLIVKDSQGRVLQANSNGSYSVPAGETQLTVAVNTTSDDIYEGPETFELNGHTEFMTSDVQGIGTITDDGSGADGDDDTDSNPTDGTDNDGSVDDDRPQMVIGDATTEEGSSAVFNVTVGKAEAPYTITFNTSTNGSAEPEDLGRTLVVKDSGGNIIRPNSDGSYTVPAGETSLTVAVATNNDGIYEGAETFELNGKTQFMTSDTSGTGTITDDGTGTDGDDDTDTDPRDGIDNEPSVDDDRPKLTISDATTEEGSSLSFAARLSNPTEYSETFTLSVQGPSTIESDDIDTDRSNWTVTYGSSTITVAADGSFTLPAGVVDFTINVPTEDDSEFERSEYFTLNVAAASSYIDDTDTASGTITDDGTGIDGEDVDSDPLDNNRVDDDRPISITAFGIPGDYDLEVDPTLTKLLVNEGSNVDQNPSYAVFKVEAAIGYPIQLNISTDTSWNQTDLDNQTPIQYLKNGVWVAYDPSQGLVIDDDSNGHSLEGFVYVRVDISEEQDDDHETSERLPLKASYVSNSLRYDEAHVYIVDEGNGERFEAREDNPIRSTEVQLDDDRPGFGTTPPPPPPTPDIVEVAIAPPVSVDAYVLDAVRDAREALNAVQLADAMETDAQRVIDDLTQGISTGIALYVIPAVDEARAETVELFNRLASDTSNAFYASTAERSQLFETTPLDFDPTRAGQEYGSSVDSPEYSTFSEGDVFGGSIADDELLRRAFFGEPLSSNDATESTDAQPAIANTGFSRQLQTVARFNGQGLDWLIDETNSETVSADESASLENKLSV